MTVRYLVGDVRERLGEISSGSVDLIASSPPFLALRSYLPAGHVAKGDEIGSEANPAAFIDTLLALTAEWARVLATHGSIAIELGDTFAGSGGGGGDYLPGGMREGQQQFSGSATASMRESNAEHWRLKQRSKSEWPRPKCLALIPQLYAVALAYGINPLTGAESPAGQWLVRNVVVWHRPNPAVGALGDKFRPSTSYIVVATRSAKRWFDLTAVRNADSNVTRLVTGYAMVGGQPDHNVGPRALNQAGAPPLDCWFDTESFDGHETWTLTTQPSSLAHYAMWPAKLAERLILSMCPLDVCRECGEPRRRLEAITGLVDNKGRQVERVNWASGMDHVDPDSGKRSRMVDGVMGGQLGAMSLKTTGGTTTTTTTTGWSDCGHDDYRPGVVLDPFAGTGTSLAVADLHGRNAVGIDIDARNEALYPARWDEVKRALFGTQPELPGQLGFEMTA